MGIETGWTSTWIAAGLGIPEIAGATSDGSYWSLVTRRSLAAVTQQYCKSMFEEHAAVACKTAEATATAPLTIDDDDATPPF